MMARTNTSNLVCSIGACLIGNSKKLSASSYLTMKRLNSSSASDTRKLANRTILITGSTYGIGHSIAKRCYQEGANIILSSRNQENVDKAVDDMRSNVKNNGSNKVFGIPCHVGKENDRQRLVDFTLEKFGRIDGFVSNAAVNPHVGPIDEVEESKVDKMYDVNYKAALILTQKILPHMKKIGKEKPSGCGPSIIFISTVASFIGLPYLGAYAASKASLFTLAKVLAQENGKHNIRVNCIAPGLIDTQFAQSVVQKREIFGHYIKNVLGRLGKVNEIDGLASFLLSDDASYLTSEIIAVNGGMLARF